MAHMMGASLRNPGVPPLVRDWIRYSNSATLYAITLGSGADIATIHVGGGVVKAFDWQLNEHEPFILRDNGGTLCAYEATTVGAQRFQPVWYEFANTLTISKTAGAVVSEWAILVATSQIEDPAVGLA